MDALDELQRRGLIGVRFSPSEMRGVLRRAAKHVVANPEIDPAVKAECCDVTPYQLRHSFLTMVVSITMDDRAVMVLAQHAEIRQTHRYTQATADPRAVAGLGQVAAKLGAKVPADPATTMPTHPKKSETTQIP